MVDPISPLVIPGFIWTIQITELGAWLTTAFLLGTSCNNVTFQPEEEHDASSVDSQSE
jgi:hypothetical protein